MEAEMRRSRIDTISQISQIWTMMFLVFNEKFQHSFLWIPVRANSLIAQMKGNTLLHIEKICTLRWCWSFQCILQWLNSPFYKDDILKEFHLKIIKTKRWIHGARWIIKSEGGNLVASNSWSVANWISNVVKWSVAEDWTNVYLFGGRASAIAQRSHWTKALGSARRAPAGVEHAGPRAGGRRVHPGHEVAQSLPIHIRWVLGGKSCQRKRWDRIIIQRGEWWGSLLHKGFFCWLEPLSILQWFPDIEVRS